MGWGQVVHENRKKAELQRAREELRLRKRGYDVELKPDANMPAVVALSAVLSAAAWWRRGNRTPQGRDWRSIPGIAQLLEFINPGSSKPKKTAARGKAKPRQQLVPPAKAAAARQAAARAAGGSSGGSNAAAAAAVRSSSNSGSTAATMQQVSSSTSKDAGQQQQQQSKSKAKKKKTKKKK